MKSLLLAIILLSTHTIVQAQHASLDSMIVEKNFFSFSPFNLIDPVAPNIELGYERVFNARVGLQISLAKLFKSDFIEFYDTPVRSGVRAKIEAKKYYLNKSNSLIYIGFETSYTYMEERKTADFGGCVYCDSKVMDSIIDVNNNVIYTLSSSGYEDSITIYRNTLIFNFKLGIREKVYNSFYIESYIGLGFKLRYVKHSGRIDEKDELSETRHPSSRRDEQGFSIVPSLPINVKIGYSF